MGNPAEQLEVFNRAERLTHYLIVANDCSTILGIDCAASPRGVLLMFIASSFLKVFSLQLLHGLIFVFRRLSSSLIFFRFHLRVYDPWYWASFFSKEARARRGRVERARLSGSSVFFIFSIFSRSSVRTHWGNR